ncbi:hypothetical protein SAMN05421823_102504 [Catalinimonas alkaloidigena]|uniref:Uncharacterized protein n=1 Tax=Catalinimonas alkaloidigena TaxID=1075417 RepID=A0A1G9B3Z8_9BACT|nr:hypothetical protein [Catalinimonas alkaloidigena]SDK34223.1 hypothetical protein SAMN05421823_102504 [Catalinimonas alkaloidigena]
MANFHENLQLVEDWAHRTDQLLHDSLRRRNIGVSEALYASLFMQVTARAGGMIGVDLSFLLRGRFVDIGAGRARKLHSQNHYRQAYGKTGRRPKKWYSRPFYGRLHALNNVLMAEITEEALDSITTDLRSA